MTEPSRTDIDQQELKAAIVQLTEGKADKDQEMPYYRNPLEVAREEWREKQRKKAAKGLRPEVLANMPTAQLLETPAPATPAETVDMLAFEQAKANWPK